MSYSYDENGNRITRNRTQLGSVPETPFTATYDANNRMLTYNGQPLTYDDNGNLISRQTPQGTATYTWDAQNRLINISGPNGTASFVYDYRGRRIDRTVNGTTTAYLFDGPQAIAELQGSSIGTTYLTGLQIDEVLARYAGSGNRTLLADALGSVLALTDDTATSQTIYGYSPYGDQTQVGANDANSLQYTGRENDNTGLYFYRARFYAPDLKRFVSSDPIGLAGGVNVFSYVNANPLGFIDPNGLDATNWWNNTGGRNPLTNGPTNGNWGGKCWSGGAYSCGGNPMGNAPPTDSADACYMAHDQCYAAAESAGPSACGTKSAASDKNACDDALVSCLNTLPSDSTRWPIPPPPGTEPDTEEYRREAIWLFSHH